MSSDPSFHDFLLLYLSELFHYYSAASSLFLLSLLSTQQILSCSFRFTGNVFRFFQISRLKQLNLRMLLSFVVGYVAGFRAHPFDVESSTGGS